LDEAIERFVAKAEPSAVPAKILHEHVASSAARGKSFYPRRFEIQHQTFLVSIEMREVETKERIRCKVTIRIAPAATRS